MNPTLYSRTLGEHYEGSSRRREPSRIAKNLRVLQLSWRFFKDRQRTPKNLNVLNRTLKERSRTFKEPLSFTVYMHAYISALIYAYMHTFISVIYLPVKTK